jgi:hypothetical protein
MIKKKVSSVTKCKIPSANRVRPSEVENHPYGASNRASVGEKKSNYMPSAFAHIEIEIFLPAESATPVCPMKGKNQVITGSGLQTMQYGYLCRAGSISHFITTKGVRVLACDWQSSSG